MNPTIMEDVFKIGEKLRSLRQDKKWTQEHVAIELGLKPTTYSDYERSAHQVPPDVVLRATEL